MGDETNIASEGWVDLYYDNKDSLTIPPKTVVTCYIKHELDRKIKGLVYIIPDDMLKESFIYFLDNIIFYIGEERLQVNLYNYGHKALRLEDKDCICNIIINEIEEAIND